MADGAADEHPPRGGTTGGSPRGGHHGRPRGPLHGIGIGIGWRPAIAGAADDLPGLRFCEVVAESLGVGAAPPSLCLEGWQSYGGAGWRRSRTGCGSPWGVRSRSRAALDVLTAA